MIKLIIVLYNIDEGLSSFFIERFLEVFLDITVFFFLYSLLFLFIVILSFVVLFFFNLGRLLYVFFGLELEPISQPLSEHLFLDLMMKDLRL
jgi:hypothetical protein